MELFRMVKKIAWWNEVRPFLADGPEDDPDSQYCPFRDGMCIEQCVFYTVPETDADEPCMLVEFILTKLYG